MIDFNLNDGPAVLNKDYEYVAQLIEILFKTTPGEVFGDLNFGTRYDKYLYDLKFSPLELQQAINTDLMTLDLCGFTPEINVTLLDGTERDIILIDIKLVKNDVISFEKIYQIS